MSPKLPVVKPKELLRILVRNGFIVHRQRGSHIILKHPARPGKIVILPNHNQDMRDGTLLGLLKQAGLSKDDLINILDN